jgi:hypothetical protein
MDDNLTPPRESSAKAMTMSFPDAMKEIIGGNKVTRIEWANDDYCFLEKKDGILSIFREGKTYWWKVSEGDMVDTQDWIVVNPVEVLKEIAND